MTAAHLDDRQPDWEWATCAASVTGSEHERRGLGCDDAYSCGVDGDFVVAAVADGAGSVTGTSAWGAYIACRSVLDAALQPSFIDSYRCGSTEHAQRLVQWLFEAALDQVCRQAETMGLDVSLLSTTLCVAVADGNLSTFGQIGDGVIAAETNGTIETLLVERKEGYANTTSFLQSDRALDDALRTTTRTGVTAFALSTDGMSYKITDVATGNAYEPFFRGTWQHVRSGASADEFAALLRGIEHDQTGDDKTMVLAAARPVAAEKSVAATASTTAHSSPLPPLAAEAETEPLTTDPPRRRRTWWGRRSR